MDDLNCAVVEDQYVTASQVVCRAPTPPRHYEHVREYTVYVVTKPSTSPTFDQGHSSSSLAAEDSSSLLYRYTEPDVVSVEPRKGIKSGGTMLRVVGRNLACGAELKIKFTSNMAGSCEIVNTTTTTTKNRRDGSSNGFAYSLIDGETSAESSSLRKADELDEIYCRTPAYSPSEWTSSSSGSKSTLQTGLLIRMDDYVHVLNVSKFRFEYVEDPRVSSVDPDSAIMSGGITMNIRGREFDSLQSAQLFLSPVPVSPASYSSRLVSASSSSEIAYDLESSNTIFKSVSLVFFWISCRVP